MSSKLRLTSKCLGRGREKINTGQVPRSSCLEGLGQEPAAGTQTGHSLPSEPQPLPAAPESCLLSWTSQGGGIDPEWVQTLEYNSVIIRKKTHVKTLWCFPCHRCTCPVTTGLGSSPPLQSHTCRDPQPILRVQTPQTLFNPIGKGILEQRESGDNGKLGRQNDSVKTSEYKALYFPWPVSLSGIFMFYVFGWFCFYCLPLPDTRIPAPWGRNLLFCQLLCPQHLQERLTYRTHTINMCWINEWKHYANIY